MLKKLGKSKSQCRNLLEKLHDLHDLDEVLSFMQSSVDELMVNKGKDATCNQ